MFKPLNNRILVKPLEKSKETAGGILLAEKVVEKPVTGIVVVEGEVVSNSKVVKLEVGQKILFSKFGYDEVEIDNEMHYVVSDYNILGIF